MFALTWPQFQSIGAHLDRICWNRALNEVFFGVIAAFGEEKERMNLFRSAGGYVGQREEKRTEWTEGTDFTPEMVEAARRRALEYSRNGGMNNA